MDHVLIDALAQAFQDLPRPLPTYRSKAEALEKDDVAKLLDHTLLKNDATKEQIDLLCEEAKHYQFKAVCVRLPWVSHCVENLKDSGIVVACVVGFHEGTQSTESKVSEAREAISLGATELDLVINYPLLRSPFTDEYEQLFDDIRAVRIACPAPLVLKCILETSQLTEREIVAGGVFACEAGADFLKTSTGFCGGGATTRAVGLLRRVAERYSGRVKVKASGGIRTWADVEAMVEAGAQRIGTSAGVSIMEEGPGQAHSEGGSGGN